jgi:UDP-N-acetylmuramate--alanine ligase
VTDPSAPSRGEEITPRFSYMKPFVTVCTNLRHDHPDVYPTFDDTKKFYARFFNQIQDGGVLVANTDDQDTIESLLLWPERNSRRIVWFGQADEISLDHSGAEFTDHYFLLDSSTFSSQNGETSCLLVIPHLHVSQRVTLQLPGMFNLRNAVAAIAACSVIGIEPTQAIEALSSFHSTQRRSQFVGEKHGVRYYDDYAHHPHEVQNIVHAFREWFPERRLVIAFQSHTFSRTKEFFQEFVDAFSEASKVVMIDIFPSAREAFDPIVSSDQFCEAINKKYPQLAAVNVKTLAKLAEFCTNELKPGDIVLTVGAGDIYQMYDMIQ